MPRTSRRNSETHIYHVMLRGNEKKKIFEDTEDKARFIDIICRKKEETDFCLYAYCIMDNHVHLVIKELEAPISHIMKSIGTSYASYYNKKYNRVGHVFQDRYKSEPVENDRYLLAVIRYVHKNPVKAGICKVQDYKWSSYRFYIRGGKNRKGLVECEEILKFFSEDRNKAVAFFKEFCNEEASDDIMDVEEDTAEGYKLDEKEAQEYVRSYLAEKNILMEHLKNGVYKNERDFLVKELVKKSRLSLREIAEMLRLNRETVRTIRLSEEPSR